MLKKIVFIAFCFLSVSACKEGRKDYHEFVSLKDVVSSPKDYEGRRLELVGFGLYEEVLPALTLYLDKNQSKDLFTTKSVFLVSNSIVENDHISANCSGKSLMAFGILEIDDMGLSLKIDKGIKTISGDGKVEDYCYKPK